MNIQENAEYFKYLFELQQSGRTNMFGAAAFLQSEMRLDRNKSKAILAHWMTNYDTIAKELGVEV